MSSPRSSHSPRSHKDDKPLARIKEALLAFGYSRLIETPPSGTQHEIYQYGKVSIQRLGGSAIGIYKATYFSDSKSEYSYIARMLPQDPALDCYMALREMNEPALNSFLPVQYAFIMNAAEIKPLNYALEIIEYCENGSLDKHLAHSTPSAFQYALQVTQMMLELIKAGYAYTDLKSSNLIMRGDHLQIMSESQPLILTDYKSLMRPRKNNLSAPRILSTPVYQSSEWSALEQKNAIPTEEQILAEICHKLGITLYEIATGHYVTKEFFDKGIKACEKRNIALSQYQTALLKIKEIPELKEVVTRCDEAFSAFKKAIEENNELSSELEDHYMLALCSLRTDPSTKQTQQNKDLVQQLQETAATQIKNIKKIEKLTLNDFLKLDLIPNTHPEEKILHNVINRCIHPDSNKRCSIELAFALLTSVRIEPKPAIPKLKMPRRGDSNSMLSARSSATNSPHSPTSLGHSSSSPTTPNSHSSSKSSGKNSQSAPTTPHHPRVRRHESVGLFFDSDQSSSESRERSSTFASDTSPAYLAISLDYSSSTSRKHGDRKRESKQRSNTIAASSSDSIIADSSRPRSNTEVNIDIDRNISLSPRKKFRVTTSDAIDTAKSTSAPTIPTKLRR